VKKLKKNTNNNYILKVHEKIETNEDRNILKDNLRIKNMYTKKKNIFVNNYNK